MMFFNRKSPSPYPTFNRRMLASSIDLGIVMLFTLPFIDWLMQRLFVPVDLAPLMQTLQGPGADKLPDGAVLSAVWGTMVDQHVLERSFMENFLQLICFAAYFLPFWFAKSNSPGKMVFQMEIRDVKTGAKMSDKQCLLRFLGYIVSALPLTFGFIWIAFDRDRRGWHDHLAGTIVVSTTKKARMKRGEKGVEEMENGERENLENNV